MYMVSRTRKRGKNGMSKSKRKRRAKSRRAKEEAEGAAVARRERRVNSFKSFGKRAAAALLVCGAFAVGINSNDSRADFSRKEKPQEPSAKVSPKKENTEKGGFGSGNEVFLALKEGRRELTLTSNAYSEGWSNRPDPWANARPMLDRMDSAGTQDSAAGGEEQGVEGGGKSKKGKGGEPPKREKPKPWRIDWDHLDALPARRTRKFPMGPLEPEDEEGEKGKGA
jgi:hypothetical protein